MVFFLWKRCFFIEMISARKYWFPLAGPTSFSRSPAGAHPPSRGLLSWRRLSERRCTSPGLSRALRRRQAFTRCAPFLPAVRNRALLTLMYAVCVRIWPSYMHVRQLRCFFAKIIGCTYVHPCSILWSAPEDAVVLMYGFIFPLSICCYSEIQAFCLLYKFILLRICFLCGLAGAAAREP